MLVYVKEDHSEMTTFRCCITSHLASFVCSFSQTLKLRYKNCARGETPSEEVLFPHSAAKSLSLDAHLPHFCALSNKKDSCAVISVTGRQREGRRRRRVDRGPVALRSVSYRIGGKVEAG